MVFWGDLRKHGLRVSLVREYAGRVVCRRGIAYNINGRYGHDSVHRKRRGKPRVLLIKQRCRVAGL